MIIYGDWSARGRARPRAARGGRWCSASRGRGYSASRAPLSTEHPLCRHRLSSPASASEYEPPL